MDERGAWEHELADVEAALEGELEEAERAALEGDRDRLTALLAVDDELEAVPGADVSDYPAGETGQPAVVPVGREAVQHPELAAEYMHTGAELVVVDQSDVFEVLDRHDENMVLEELQKRGVKALFYDFGSGNNRVVDLSIKGVLECVGLMNRTGKCRIAVDPQSAVIGLEEQDGKRYVTARVYAIDAVTGFGVFGMAKQPLYMELRGGKEKWDPFAETKALNKAQRNALGMLIPQKIRLAMVAMAKKDTGLAREIAFGVGAAQQAELPPPLADERANALVAECRDLFRRLAAVNPQAMMPGQFGVGLARSQHSHDVLETFRDELAARLAHEEEKAGAPS